METLTTFLEQHGYWLVAGVGFAEYAGAPIASVPVLVAAGALAAQVGLHPVAIAVIGAAGGLAADALWYAIARWQGHRVVGSACGLTSNPNACVLGVRDRLERLGPGYIMTVKFIPGAGNLVAVGAALARIRAVPFLLLDAVALLLWAGAYVALGVVFAAQVEAVIAVAAGYARWALAVVLLLIGLGAIWRLARARRHATAHPGSGNGGEGEDGPDGGRRDGSSTEGRADGETAERRASAAT